MTGDRVVLHVDMDAFFAAVEVLDDATLAGRPLIVGGDGLRGVVASCSYEARRYGVRSAMPSVRARRLCPAAVFRPARHDRYQELSRSIHEVFHRFTPLVEGVALDEAFLDVTGSGRLFGTGPEVAVAVRAAILDTTGLHCSVGVARSKFLAKLASEAAKPSADRGGIRPGPGIVVLTAGTELDFLHPLPVEALWGVGPATAQRLRGIGITTVGLLASTPAAVLEATVGRAAGRHLHQLAQGVDDRPVEPDRALKSVGHEETFATDRWDGADLRCELARMTASVAARLRAHGVAGRTVQVKLRMGDFSNVSRSRTVATALDEPGAILDVAVPLLDSVEIERGVRLLGVSVGSLEEAGGPGAEQLTLDLAGIGDAALRSSAIPAIDAVRRRYGPGALHPASALPGATDPNALL